MSWLEGQALQLDILRLLIYIYITLRDTHGWCEIKNGCVMVTAHADAVLGKKLFCIEWKN